MEEKGIAKEGNKRKYRRFAVEKGTAMEESRKEKKKSTYMHKVEKTYEERKEEPHKEEETDEERKEEETDEEPHKEEDERKYMPMYGVASMKGVDRWARIHDTGSVQLFIDETTSLSDAVDMNTRMRAGVSGEGFLVYNPEVLRRKISGEMAVRIAVVKMEWTVKMASRKIKKTRKKIKTLRKKLDMSSDSLRIGPSINHRALAFEQVLFPGDGPVPDDNDAEARRMSKNERRQLRKLDARSQMAFWDFNLKALKSKLKAEVAFRDTLKESVRTLSTDVLQSRTDIGCGFTDYSFAY